MSKTFVTLSSWNRKIKVGEEFVLEVTCHKTSQANDAGGYAVNFQKTRHEKNDILFHFNPRGKTSHVVLNTVTNSSWGEETKIEDENVAKIYFESPFKLKIVPIKDNLIHVYVNDKFKTEYECKERKITDTSFIIFSPFVSIHPL